MYWHEDQEKEARRPVEDTTGTQQIRYELAIADALDASRFPHSLQSIDLFKKPMLDFRHVGD